MQDLTQSVSPRFQTSEVVVVEVYGRMGKLVTKMKNLSLSGAFLQLMEGGYVPVKGDLIHAVVQLRTLRRTRIFDGEVVWMSGLGFGVNFLKRKDLLEKMFSQRQFE